MLLDELFVVEEVEVNISKNDLPGPTKFKAVCKECGIVVRDKKRVLQGRQGFMQGLYRRSLFFKKEKSVISQNSRVNIT